MNWDAIGAIAEIAGAMAVLLTLIFIAKQISIHSTELERANQFHNAQSTMSNNATVCTNLAANYARCRLG